MIGGVIMFWAGASLVFFGSMARRAFEKDPDQGWLLYSAAFLGIVGGATLLAAAFVAMLQAK